MGYLEESLVVMELPPPPTVAAGRALYERLATPRLQVRPLLSLLSLCHRHNPLFPFYTQQSEMARRVTDLQKSVKEMNVEMDVLRKITENCVAEADR